MRKFILAGAIVSLTLMSFNSGNDNTLKDNVDDPSTCIGGERTCTVSKNRKHP